MVGKIIAPTPLANMKKMSDLVVCSFLSTDEPKDFFNLAENAQGSKG